MPRHLLATLALAASIILPAPVQAEADAGRSPTPTVAPDDSRIEDLRALLPEDLGGLPLREEFRLSVGEQLAGSMEDEERAIFETMLETAGKDYHDYVAANAIIRLSDANALAILAHRVVGIDAGSTTGAWLEILGLNARQPRVVYESIAGRDVYLVSDDARPSFPRLHVFAAGDVIWMVAVDNDDVAAEAVRVLSEAALRAGNTE